MITRKMQLNTELFNLLRISGQTQSRELIQMANINQYFVNTLHAHAALLLRSNAVLELAQGTFDMTSFVREFLQIYGHTNDEDTRHGMLEDIKTLSRITPDGITLGKIDRRCCAGRKILHIPPTMIEIDDGFSPPGYNVEPCLLPLSHVVSIGRYFLMGSACVRLDLSPLRLITSIDGYFLSGCRSLVRIDLSPLSRVTHIPISFLHGCSSLQELNLTPLKNVTLIAMMFLAECHSLTKLDLTPLSKVTYIGMCFLHKCTSLVDVNINALQSVTEIGPKFLDGCPARTITDMSSLRSAWR